MNNLKNVAIFSGLNNQQLLEVKKHCSIRPYPKNTVVIYEGDDTDSLYIIDSGKVNVFLSDKSGKEVIINTQGPGEYFGELSVLTGHNRSASVITKEKCLFTVIYRQGFKTLLEDNPNIAYNIMQNLAIRVQELTGNVKSLALQDVYGRVVKVLMSLSEPIESSEANKRLINQKLTQQEIANRVGSSREMVARILKALTVGGYISHEKEKIVINNKLPEHY
ncbi:MAG: Crp/Fnr family transcriptional regulator [Moraxellaceae bacterium]|nr:MAG: Crp/Fnr family transcriptional regulator [Moraxellaceae bacterium]